MSYDDWKCSAPDPVESPEYTADELEVFELVARLERKNLILVEPANLIDGDDIDF